jgi:uncharacterized protein YyaL (SSP411 family)
MTDHQNKLINEKSPYLLQHAHNPVNWYPWGDEAFEKAQNKNKPVFLSIGYSTCHWCHVMAHESFEDEEVAALLNKHYVSIKVDREERPDIDSVYMKVCQMMTGHGGWPLTVIMTPDKVPFYAGTYFPKTSKHGIPGLMELVTGLAKKFCDDPEHITEVTKDVVDALKETTQTQTGKRLEKTVVKQAFKALKRDFNPENGGFGHAPKFPQPQNLLFLLRYYHFSKDVHALSMVEETAKRMANGGIFDQIGFGFARYATDEAWIIPHFEKMLYDNALLLLVYTECYQMTGDPFYKQVGEQIITFIRREMTAEDGAFYSAIDADSEGKEGKYYVWDYEEVFEILGEDLGDLYTTIYNMTPYGNFEGKNIPHWGHDHVAGDLTANELEKKIEKARLKLLVHREKRVYPHVDDKILTSWNGMMIVSLAKAGMVFHKEQYVKTAMTSLDFIEKSLIKNGRIMARFRDGETKYNGYLDDYAYLIWGYITLYEATFQLHYVQKAKAYMDDAIKLFWDPEHGGFFQTGSDSEKLISREKEIHDGALPSGNGVMANLFVKLTTLTGEMDYLEKWEAMNFTFYEDLNKYASAGIFFIQSVLLTENPRKEVVVLGSENDPDRKKLLNDLQNTFLPHITVLVAERAEDLAKVAPFAAEYEQLEGKTTVYVCENFSCHQPTTDMEVALQHIRA